MYHTGYLKRNKHYPIIGEKYWLYVCCTKMCIQSKSSKQYFRRKDNNFEMYLEQDEPNEDWLCIKPKTSKQISWISHQSISSKLQKC